MYTRKLFFSGFSIPLLVYANTAADFQRRRKEDKLKETQRR